jgi:hypothetical protein
MRGEVRHILEGTAVMGEFPIDNPKTARDRNHGSRPEVSHGQTISGAEKNFADFGGPLADFLGIANARRPEKSGNGIVKNIFSNLLDTGIVEEDGETPVSPCPPVQLSDKAAECFADHAGAGKAALCFRIYPAAEKDPKVRKRADILHDNYAVFLAEIQETWRTNFVVRKATQRFVFV